LDTIIKLIQAIDRLNLVRYHKRWELSRHFRLHLYVTPAERRKGIGTELWRAASGDLEQDRPNLISTHFAVDNGDPAPFYRQRGFKKWYGCVNLEYKGGLQPDPNLEFDLLEEKYLDQYMEIRQDAFYQMHRDNDIIPYRTPADKKMRDFIQKEGEGRHEPDSRAGGEKL